MSQIAFEYLGHVVTKRELELVLSHAYSVACGTLLTSRGLRSERRIDLSRDAIRQTECGYYEDNCPDIYNRLVELLYNRSVEIETAIKERLATNN